MSVMLMTPTSSFCRVDDIDSASFPPAELFNHFVAGRIVAHTIYDRADNVRDIGLVEIGRRNAVRTTSARVFLPCRARIRAHQTHQTTGVVDDRRGVQLMKAEQRGNLVQRVAFVNESGLGVMSSAAVDKRSTMERVAIRFAEAIMCGSLACGFWGLYSQRHA